MRLFNPFLTVGLTFLIMAGCGPKTRKAGGMMDDPQTHYEQGMKYYNGGEISRAGEEFKSALSLDKKFAAGYAGLALVLASEGNFKEAYKNIDKALGLNDKLIAGYIASGIVITLENQGKDNEDWIADAVKQYDKIIKKLDPKNSEAYYRKGWTLKKGLDFKGAEENFKKVLELDKDYTKEADEQYKLVQDIQRAAPGSRVGKKIALVDEISKADICALFISELDATRLIQKKRPKNYDTGFKAPEDTRSMTTKTTIQMASATDIESHWAKNFIGDVLKLEMRGLEADPSHKFYPDNKITRAEYALMVEDILISILNDPKLATKNIGAESSRFPDVNPSNFYYNAICNAVDKNIMDGKMNGEFEPQGTVSGPDALLVIRKLKELKK